MKYNPSDMSKTTIQALFYKQIRDLTMKSNMSKSDTFDIQFSDQWI